MSKKRYVDALDEMDDSTYELLGSRISKLAPGTGGKSRFRERRASERRDDRRPPKPKRPRDRHA
ncbi:MAG TPA: hypothetical protein VE175_02815 [Woeseiaceae bacterium]|nr:hypothetical protein [Woeseiaceae bacterium]